MNSPSEHEEERPIDLVIDLVGLDPAGEQQQRTPVIATLATGWPAKNKITIAAYKDRLDDERPMVTRRTPATAGNAHGSETHDGR